MGPCGPLKDESLLSIVDQLRRDCPRWCTDKQRLLVKLDTLLGQLGGGKGLDVLLGVFALDSGVSSTVA